jgi:hypothetical protein
MNASHHHHFSPLTIAFVIAGGAMLTLAHNGYFKAAFRNDILASINPADVLTTSDMIPEQPAVPVNYRRITVSVH